MLVPNVLPEGALCGDLAVGQALGGCCTDAELPWDVPHGGEVVALRELAMVSGSFDSASDTSILSVAACQANQATRIWKTRCDLVCRCQPSFRLDSR